MWKRFFSRQARKPSGWFGRIVAKRLFDKGNDKLNSLMVQLMNAHRDETVLEIGFGCGNVICQVAEQIGNGSVVGIDFSDAMIDIAKERNRHHIAEGRVELIQGDFDSTNYDPQSFDTVCSANTIYFWPDVAATLGRIHGLTKDGGKVVLAFVGKDKMDSMPLDMEVFHSVSPEMVVNHMVEAGFHSIEVHDLDNDSHSYCLVGRK